MHRIARQVRSINAYGGVVWLTMRCALGIRLADPLLVRSGWSGEELQCGAYGADLVGRLRSLGRLPNPACWDRRGSLGDPGILTTQSMQVIS